MASWTFALLKPDAVSNPVVLRWISQALEANSLRVTKGCRMLMGHALAEDLYDIHRQKFFFERLIRHVCSGPVVAMRLESAGPDAIRVWRKVLGPSKLFANLYREEAGAIGQRNGFRSLRLLFALSDTRNTGHGSDSADELNREYGLFERHMHTVGDVNSELFLSH